MHNIDIQLISIDYVWLIIWHQPGPGHFEKTLADPQDQRKQDFGIWNAI